MPGRFAETLDSCRLRRQPRPFFFAGKNPNLGAGSAGLRCRAGGALGIEASTSGWRGSAGQECDAGKHKCHLRFRSGRVGGSDAGQVVRPGWRLLCRAGGAAGVSTRSDDDPPRCAGNLAFVTLVPPMLGEPVLIGRASTILSELASNRAGRASIEDWASIKHYWRLLSAAPLAQWTRASATCSVAPNLAPPHLLSGRGRLPLVQWLQISHRPTCSVDAGVCHLLSGTKFRTSPTCSVDAGVSHLFNGSLPPSRNEVPQDASSCFFHARKCLCQLKQRWKKI